MTMKRALAGFILLMLVAVIPNPAIFKASTDNSNTGFTIEENGEFLPSGMNGTGLESEATPYFTRNISSLETSILNNYGAPNAHDTILELEQYHISGWHLFELDISIENIIAAPEREIVGNTSSPATTFKIYEHDPDQYYSALAQGFYNQPFDGQLVNYSVMYATINYDPEIRGRCYLTIYADYQNSSTNLTSYLPMDGSGNWKWITQSGSGSILSNNTEYFAIFNGTDLHEGGVTSVYPEVLWASEDSQKDFGSYRYDTAINDWYSAELPYEGFVNYTYVPWNTSTDSALIYSNPEDIDLRVNGSAVFGSLWSFQEPNNISSLQISSNQSIYVHYNLTLHYKRQIVSHNTWLFSDATTTINWSTSVSLSYPRTTGNIARFLNLTKQSDWSPLGFYNDSSNKNHDNYTVYSRIVVCSNLTNGSWTLVSSAPNYVTEIATSDSSDETPLRTKASILTDLDIDITIEDASSNPADSGTTNLTITNESITVYAPSNQSVSSGLVSYLWDIDATTSVNGSYTIGVYWTNGTEAGYLTKAYLVYLPTSFTAESYSIAAHTESSFEIRVHFDETYSDIGLNSTYASVKYSFEGESNVSMIDGHNNGTWSSTISTVDRKAGTYQVDVFAEGYCVENQTLTITVTLTVETLPLSYDWTNSENISYVEQTTLKVNYSMYNGTEVEGATINITIGSNWWIAVWNESSLTYDLTFNGTDDPPGFGTFTMDINASATGFDSKITTASLTLHIETTDITIIWSNGNSISYVENTTLKVNYTMSNGSAVLSATINISIGLESWLGVWNETSSTYDLAFSGTDESPGLGTFTIQINANATGFESQAATESFDIHPEPTSLTRNWDSNSIEWTESVYLKFNFTDSYGVLIDGATQKEIYVNGTLYALSDSGNGTYWYLFDNSFDLGNYDIWVNISKHGYVHQESTGITLDIVEATTSLDVIWDPLDRTIDYTERLNLTVEYTHEGEDITGDVYVNVTINNETYVLNWTVSYWYGSIPGSSITLGDYSAEVKAWSYGYSPGNSHSQVNITEAITTLTVIWEPANATVEYTQRLNVTAYYLHDGGNVPSDADVNLTIDGANYTLNWTGSYWYGFIPGSSLVPDIYTANLNAWLYGYEARLNITEVNVTEAPNSFYVVWNPSDYKATYIEQVEMVVTYTYDYSPILDATVQLILDSTSIFDFEYNSTGENWYLVLSADVIDLGIHNATVRANKTGYSSGVETQFLEIEQDTPIATPKWTELVLDYVHGSSWSVNFTSSNLTFIDDASMSFKLNSTALLANNNMNGTYSVTIPSQLDLGYYFGNATISRYGFLPISIELNITIIRSESILSLDISHLTIYYDQNSTVRIYYDLLNGSSIRPANISLQVDGVSQDIAEWGAFWESTILGVDQGIGSHSCSVSASSYGYIPQLDTFTLEIIEIPTWWNVTGSTWLYVNSSTSFEVSLVDSRDNSSILINGDPVSWTGGHTWAIEEDQVYLLLIDSHGLSTGDYLLSLSSDSTGYAIPISEIDMTVSSVPVNLDTATSFSTYENETLELSVRLSDTYHDTVIHWANIQVTFGDSVYNFSYDSGQEIYLARIWMGPEITPRNDYDLIIDSEAEDCESTQVIVMLTVLEKQTYELVLQPDSAALVGRSIGVTAILSQDDSPVEGKEIHVWAEFTINGDEEVVHLTAITNQQGIAQVNFDVPESTTSLTVWGEFVGSESEWSVTTSRQDISVERADLLTLFAGFITSIQGLVLIIAITVFVGAYVGYTRKHKPKKLAEIRSLKQQHEAFKDLESLQHYMAIYLDRGTCVFYHPFRDSRIEPDLISGFIAAITSVYGEIKGNGVKGSLEEIHYQGLRLNCFSGRYIISILILEREMTPILKDRLQFFTEMFEQAHESDLHEWVGSVDCFDPGWIIDNLYSAFHYSWVLPHKVENLKEASRTEQKIVEFIEDRIEGEEFLIGDHLSDLAKDFGRTEEEMLDKLLSMQEAEIIQPIGIQTVIQRQGLGLSGIEEEDGAKKVVSQEISADEGADMELPSVEDMEDAETISEQEEGAESDNLETEEEIEPAPEPEEEDDEKDIFISEVEGLLAKKKKTEKTGEESDSD